MLFRDEKDRRIEDARLYLQGRFPGQDIELLRTVSIADKLPAYYIHEQNACALYAIASMLAFYLNKVHDKSREKDSGAPGAPISCDSGIPGTSIPFDPVGAPESSISVDPIGAPEISASFYPLFAEDIVPDVFHLYNASGCNPAPRLRGSSRIWASA